MMLREMVLMRAKAKQVMAMVLNPTDLRCKSPPLLGEVKLNRWFRFWELPTPTGFLLVLFHHTIILVVIVAWAWVI